MSINAAKPMRVLFVPLFACSLAAHAQNVIHTTTDSGPLPGHAPAAAPAPAQTPAPAPAGPAYKAGDVVEAWPDLDKSRLEMCTIKQVLPDLVYNVTCGHAPNTELTLGEKFIRRLHPPNIIYPKASAVTK